MRHICHNPLCPFLTDFRQGVARIRQHFDEELRALLQSLLLLMSASDTSGSGSGPAAAQQQQLSHHQRMMQRMPSQANGGGSGSSSGTSRGSGGAAAGGGGADVAAAARAAELEPFAQDKCAEMAAAVAAELRAQLDSVGELRDGAAGAPGAEQVGAEEGGGGSLGLSCSIGL